MEPFYMKPRVGSIVHFVIEGGWIEGGCRAALVTEVGSEYKTGHWTVGLAVYHPDGVTFIRGIGFDPHGTFPEMWHWPEREKSDG